MPTDTKTRNTTSYCYQWTKLTSSPYTVVVTFSGLLSSGVDNDTRTYVLARRRPKGWKPPNPYSRLITRGFYHAAPGYAYGVSGGKIRVQTGVMSCGSRSAVPSFDGGLVSQAQIGARLKVRGGKVNFAVAFAERERTKDMIASTAKRVAGSIMDIRKGDFKGAAERLGVVVPKPLRRSQGRRPKGQEVHNSFLEYKYGWQPLLSDVRGAAELMAEKDLKDPDRYMSTVKSRKALAFKTGYNKSSATIEAGHPIWVSEILKGEHSAFVRLDYVQRHPEMASLAKAGFTNPLLVAWELVPLSFVVDWFVPIGNYASLLDAELGWEFKAGSTTTRTEAKWSFWAVQRPITGWFSLSVSASGQCYRKQVNRSVHASPPIPGFIVKNPLTRGNVASALSLLAQACGRKS